MIRAAVVTGGMMQMTLQLSRGIATADGNVRIAAGETVTVAVPPDTLVRVTAADGRSIGASVSELEGSWLVKFERGES